jgi:hypothetical protein
VPVAQHLTGVVVAELAAVTMLVADRGGGCGLDARHRCPQLGRGGDGRSSAAEQPIAAGSGEGSLYFAAVLASRGCGNGTCAPPAPPNGPNVGLPSGASPSGASPSEVNFLCRSKHGLSGVQICPA